MDRLLRRLQVLTSTSRGTTVAGALFVIALAGGAFFPLTVAGQTPTWGEATKVSGATEEAWFPDLAADESGQVHVVWNATVPAPSRGVSEEGGVVSPLESASGAPAGTMSGLYYSKWTGQAWTNPNDVGLAVYGEALRTALAADGLGRLHLVRRGIGALRPEAMGKIGISIGENEIFHSTALAPGAQSVAAWSQPIRLNRTTGSGYYTDVAVDSKGVIHVVWTESGGGSWGIYYTNSADGGRSWLPRVALDGSNFVWWYRAQLAIDSRDRLHVVWEILDSGARSETGFGSTNAAAYAISTDSGRSWAKTEFRGQSSPQPLQEGRLLAPTGHSTTPPLPGPQQPAIGVDGQGKIILVCREAGSTRITYRLSADGLSWSSPAPIDGIARGVSRPYDMYSMATDGAGHVHLAAVGYLEGSGEMRLLHIEWDGSSWLRPTVVTGSPPYPEYPRLAVGTGGWLNAVWFAGDKATIDRVPVGVWHSSMQLPSSSASQGKPASRAAASVGGAVSGGLSFSPTPSSSAPQVQGSPQGEGAGIEGGVWVRETSYSQALPLTVGSGSVLILLGGTLVARIARRRFRG